MLRVCLLLLLLLVLLLLPLRPPALAPEPPDFKLGFKRRGAISGGFSGKCL